MFLRPGQFVQLRQTLWRCFTTSRPCSRKNVEAARKSRLRQIYNGPTPLGIRQELVSSGDVQVNLKAFLATVNRRLENLLYASNVRTETRGNHLPESDFEDIVFKYRDAVMANLTERMEDGNYDQAPPKIPTPDELYRSYMIDGIREIDAVILNYFKTYFVAHGHPSIRKVDLQKATAVADMRHPGEWFPGARNIRRKIIMHVGPTNSGKTYQALKRLEKAKTGWYGGPLRLLAHEVFNRMNKKGILCNLRTGEEIRINDINAPLTASTIEMFSETSNYDIAVIDEIQMISDPQRGYAWTNALLGLKAKEIHLCGEEAAVPLITKIAEELGEEIEVNRYERLSPLITESQPLDDYKNVQPGDCVVVFSRKGIFNIKKQIETLTGLNCALVYGALPPESRVMQADLFNDPNSEYDVIVASDAVGMGLNLNIKRVVFATLEKFDAGNLRYLHPPQIKQIAGRAGRFRVPGAEMGSSVPDNIGGSVTVIRKGDLRLLREGISTPNPELTHAMLWPPWKVFERFAQEFPEGTPLATMISQFAEVGRTSPHYRIVESGDQVTLAQAIEHIPNIDLESRYSMTFAPIATRSEDQTFLFVRLAEVLSSARPVTIESPKVKIPLWVLDKEDYKMTSSKLSTLEVIHKLIMCYCWLSVRWPALYTHYELAQDWKRRTEQLIHEALQSMKTEVPKKKGSKRKKILEKEDIKLVTHVDPV